MYDPHEINSFLRRNFDQNGDRLQQLFSSGSAGTRPHVYTAAPQAAQQRAELFREDLDQAKKRKPRRSSSSIATESTGYSSVFDESESHCGSEDSTVLTLPTRHSRNPGFRVNPMLNNESRRLPCEFFVYSHCDANFALDDVDSWIYHIIDHLQNELPAKCICWFCDDFPCDAEELGIDLFTNFFRRMEHIRDHFIEDHCTVDQVRPDYHFLDHLSRHRLITEDMLRQAREWNEGPAPKIADIYPHDFVPPRQTPSSQQVVTYSGREPTRQRGAKNEQRPRSAFRSGYFPASRTSISNVQRR